MAVGIGACYQGRITRIVPWGAFVTLEGTDGIQNGLIHISELSSGYVKQVSDLVSVGDTVTVRVLHIDDRGRIALSRRQAMTEEEQAEERQRLSSDRRRTADGISSKNEAVDASEEGFEEMMRRFRSESEERLKTLRRSENIRRTGKKR